jgi:ferredoxin/flavodoxin---NADP+ reductase
MQKNAEGHGLQTASWWRRMLETDKKPLDGLDVPAGVLPAQPETASTKACNGTAVLTKTPQVKAEPPSASAGKQEAVPAKAPAKAQRSWGSAYKEETVLTVRHWNEDLFSFTTTRDPSFRFNNGQFAMIGLEADGRPLVRAYSMASANYDDKLEFFSIKVQKGPLTSRLQHIKPGDRVLVGRKPTGTLVLDNLLPGSRLYLLSTGTGLAPFLSLLRDPEAYERFDKIIVAHGCRYVSDLAYHEWLSEGLAEDEFLGDMVREKFVYYPTVTREPYKNHGRITNLIKNGRFFEDIGHPPLSRAEDRIMLCGSPAMLAELREMLHHQGWIEGNMGEPGEFVIEKAFVER